MTRSVEIPEAARKAARDAALHRWATGSADTTQMLMSVDAGLLAALPYLVPAGDGGLREALEKLKRYCSEYVDGDGSEDEQIAYDDVHIRLSQILAAHPAVPQSAPVDREALRESISVMYGHLGLELKEEEE